MFRSRVVVLFLSLIAVLAVSQPASADGLVTLQKSDRIVWIGNNFAEREQYFGHIEAQIQASFPNLNITVRNQGFNGDEVRFRPRSLDFGEPDKHLTMARADVILACFGFSESFDGPDGIPTFEKELREFVVHTRKQNYSGKGAPRLVLISPLAHENLNSPDLPDGSQTNPNLELYAKAMAKVAGELNVPYLDLFGLSLKTYQSEDQPLTFNGVHLTGEGYQVLSSTICDKLFGKHSHEISQELMAEIAEKNFQYFHRYRAVNGFYIYGGRSLRPNGNPPFTDRYVLENERAKLDEMCAVVDQRIWKAAQGNPVRTPVDYSKTRMLYDVPTNFKQPIVIHPPEEAIKKFTVAKGYKVNLFASEVDFPDLKNPVQLTFDSKGRLWVATMPTYPQYQPPNKPDDKLIILEDTDGDGKADKQTVFADDLHLPTGFELGDGGAYVAQEPNLVFIKDTDGDGKYDYKRILMGGFDSGDSHHAIGAFQWGPGGGLYMHEGTFHITQVESPYGTIRNGHGAVYRVDPTRQKIETFVSYNFANPWGHCFEKWGQNFVADASGGANYFGTAFSLRTVQYEGQPDFGPFKFTYRKQMQQFFKKRVRPTAGCEIVSSRHFPPEAQGNYLLNNCIGFQGVLQHTVKDAGSGFEGQEIEPILFSSDRNFRPTDLQFGPDGALYIVDWFNPLIGHMQHNLRDPNRDHTHGRIWRVTYPSRPLNKPIDLDQKSLPQLVELLAEYENRVRNRVRIKLREFPKADVVAALDKWIAGLDQGDEEYTHHLLEALWVKQHHNVVDRKLLDQLLTSKRHEARAAATRVACYWRDYLPDVTDILKTSANDAHPRVRLEAVRAASWVNNAKAAEAALEVLKYERDYYIDYALGEVMRFLEPHWKSAIKSGETFAANNPAGIEYILGAVPTEDLAKMPPSPPVYLAMLTRPNVKEAMRLSALSGLANSKKSSEFKELTEAINYVDRTESAGAERVIYDLVLLLTRRDPSELVTARDQFASWTKNGKRAITRRIGFVAMIAADQAVKATYDAAAKSPKTLRDFLDAIPIIPDAQLRGALYPMVQPLLTGLPQNLKKLENQKGVLGRYVRIELPGRGRVLTLAEVEVFSDGTNVARKGKARQTNVGFGGVPSRAIDGNKSGRYADGGQTHTTESVRSPFWEVDLGREFPIESIAIWNRSEDNGKFAGRLNGFKLTILDSKRQPVFTRANNKAPKESIRFEIGGSPVNMIRRAAINAVTFIPGHDSETFDTLARFIQSGDQRTAAVSAMSRIPRYRWPRDSKSIRPVVLSLVNHAKRVGAKERATLAVRSGLQLANDLAGFLPASDAKMLRTEIGELGVRIVTIRTIPHRMRYDRPEVVVQAGKPFELVLENTDIMPHNLLLVNPGKMMEVAQAAERMASSPDAFAKGFVPDSKQILKTTKLLQAGESERIVMVAPTKPGDYPYVCTFPGHWRTMSGVMHVVNNVEEYLAKNPIAEPTEVMETRKFVRDWKLDEVKSQIKDLKGRSFAEGKKLFTAVACFSCHKMKGVGGAVGPELSKLDAKKGRDHILLSMIDPSKEIDKKFQAWIVVDDDGKQYTGLLLKEDKNAVTLMPNPVGIENCEPIVIPKSKIDIRQASPISLMPAKLLNTLTIEEIKDLLAYIESRGNPDHAVFKD